MSAIPPQTPSKETTASAGGEKTVFTVRPKSQDLQTASVPPEGEQCKLVDVFGQLSGFMPAFVVIPPALPKKKKERHRTVWTFCSLFSEFVRECFYRTIAYSLWYISMSCYDLNANSEIVIYTIVEGFVCPGSICEFRKTAEWFITWSRFTSAARVVAVRRCAITGTTSLWFCVWLSD